VVQAFQTFHCSRIHSEQASLLCSLLAFSMEANSSGLAAVCQRWCLRPAHSSEMRQHGRRTLGMVAPAHCPSPRPEKQNRRRTIAENAPTLPPSRQLGFAGGVIHAQQRPAKLFFFHFHSMEAMIRGGG